VAGDNDSAIRFNRLGAEPRQFWFSRMTGDTMDELDQIFGWLMIAFGVGQSVTNFRIQSSHVVAVRNSGGHYCRRVPYRAPSTAMGLPERSR
jgi:hypothetical protein